MSSVATSERIATAVQNSNEASIAELETVEVAIEGQPLIALFRPNFKEHSRRVSESVGAATNTGLLHALWALPLGIDFDHDSIAARDLRTLRSYGRGFYTEGAGLIGRTYEPPGAIAGLVVARKTLSDAVRVASKFPPIYRRVAVGEHTGDHTSLDAVCERTGVGMLSISEPKTSLIREASKPVVGVPAVYRWWIVELAYDAWLNAKRRPLK